MNDDLLDMTADERSLGKPVGNDLRERKMTIPLILALRARGPGVSRAGRAFLRRIRTMTESRRSWPPSRAKAASSRRAREIARYVERAKAALEPLPASAAKEELTRLADALARRSRKGDTMLHPVLAHHRRADHHRHPGRRRAALRSGQAAEARAQRRSGQERVHDGPDRGRRSDREGPRRGAPARRETQGTDA